MADSSRELQELASRFDAAAERFPDFRICIITGPVATRDGRKPSKPGLFNPFGLPESERPRQKQAAELLDLLASDAVATLKRVGVDVCDSELPEPSRLMLWVAEIIPSFNRQPSYGDGHGTTAKPSDHADDNELLTPKANPFVMVAEALRKLARLRQQRDDSQDFYHKLWEAKLDLFRDLFRDWLVPALREVAGLAPDAPIGPDAPHDNNVALTTADAKYRRGSRSGDPRIKDILDRAHREFRLLTGVPAGLGTVEEWRVMAMAAGMTAAEFDRADVKSINREVRAWVFAKRAQYHKPPESTHAGNKSADHLAGTKSPGGSDNAEAAPSTLWRTDAPKQDRKQETRRSKLPTPTEKLRDQRLKFCRPLKAKGKTWPEISTAYCQKYPKDAKASPATLRLTHDRNKDK